MTVSTFTNAGAAGAVTVSALAQFVGKAAHLILNVVASLALIKFLGPAGYGDYVFVLSFAALFGLLSDLGIVKVAVRDMAQAGSSAGATLGTSIALRLALGAIAWGAAQGVLALMGIAAELRIAIAVVALLYLAEAVLAIFAVFEVNLKMQYSAFVLVLIQAIDTLLILWLISTGAGLVLLVAAPVLATALGAAAALALARRRFRAQLSFDPRRMPYLVKEALPIGITMLFAVIYLRIDSVLLGILARSEDVGLYGAAYKPVEYLLLASAIIINTLFPLLARWRRDPVKFAYLYWRGTDALLLVAMPAAVLIFLVADPLVTTFYAPEFAASALPLRILAVALVFMVLTAWQGFALLSAGRQRVTMIYDAVALAVNVVLNLILIPRLGYVGAALAALATSVFVNVVGTLVARRLLELRVSSDRLGSVIAANVALGVIVWSLLPAMPWWGACVAGAATYPLWLLVFRVTSLREVRALVPVQLHIRPAKAGA